MSSNNSQHKNEDESGSGQIGTGQIEFKDFLSNHEAMRDDLLSEEEKNHLLVVHKSGSEANIKKQKEKRDTYKALKEGKLPLSTYRQEMMSVGAQAGYKVHPLNNKAQFSGVDRQVTNIANDFEAKTNEEQAHELQNKYELQNRPQLANAPKFNPKPSPY
jgi:hypothetical protein